MAQGDFGRAAWLASITSSYPWPFATDGCRTQVLCRRDRLATFVAVLHRNRGASTGRRIVELFATVSETRPAGTGKGYIHGHMHRGPHSSVGRPAIVLLSGGLDSATALAIARAAGFPCHCLSLDYGQRHHAELRAAAAIFMRRATAAFTFQPMAALRGRCATTG